MQELTLTFVSHAAVIFNGQFGKLVCDPWLLNEPVFNLSTWKFPPAVMEPKEVAKNTDYLVITHSHEDHFHLPSLDYFSRNVKIILSQYDGHPGLRACTIEQTLKMMGFYNIRRLFSWEQYKLSEGSVLTAIPHANTRKHDWENMGFILQHHDCVVLNINDNVNDEELCYKIRELYPQIDLAMIQTGGVTMYPGCFRMPIERMKIEADKRKLAFREQRRLLSIIKPKYIMPFAGDFCWLSDNYFHNNWANRTTPVLFQEMVNEYPDSSVVQLQPGDSWSKLKGTIVKHRRIDWANYLDEMKNLQILYRSKINNIEQYLKDVNLIGLKERSYEYTKNIEKFITKDYINFSARFRMSIEGQRSDFSFVLKADPINYFRIDWDDTGTVDQTLYIKEHIWAAVIEGKLMWNIIQWVAEAEQDEYHLEIGKFWFWIEYHIDLNNKNIQCNISEQLFPKLGAYLDLKRANFILENEREIINSFYNQDN